MAGSAWQVPAVQGGRAGIALRARRAVCVLARHRRAGRPPDHGRRSWHGIVGDPAVPDLAGDYPVRAGAGLAGAAADTAQRRRRGPLLRGCASWFVYRRSKLHAVYCGVGDRAAVLPDYRLRGAAGAAGAGDDLHGWLGQETRAELEAVAPAGLSVRCGGAAAFLYSVEAECFGTRLCLRPVPLADVLACGAPGVAAAAGDRVHRRAVWRAGGVVRPGHGGCRVRLVWPGDEGRSIPGPGRP